MTRTDVEAKIIERLKDADHDLLRSGRALAQVNAVLPLGWTCASIGHSADMGWTVSIAWAPHHQTFYVRPEGFDA